MPLGLYNDGEELHWTAKGVNTRFVSQQLGFSFFSAPGNIKYCVEMEVTRDVEGIYIYIYPSIYHITDFLGNDCIRLRDVKSYNIKTELKTIITNNQKTKKKKLLINYEK